MREHFQITLDSIYLLVAGSSLRKTDQDQSNYNEGSTFDTESLGI